MAYDFDVAFVNIFINTIICSYCKKTNKNTSYFDKIGLILSKYGVFLYGKLKFICK